MRSLAAFVVAGACVASPAPAAADVPVFVSPGYVHSFVQGRSPASGNGAELSSAFFFGRRTLAQAGAFGQVEALSGERGVSTRLAAGAHVSIYGVGLETAYAIRTADAAHGRTDGVHLAPFVSIGWWSLAYRWTIALRGDHGSDHGFVLGIKVPIPIGTDFDRLDLGPKRP